MKIWELWNADNNPIDGKEMKCLRTHFAGVEVNRHIRYIQTLTHIFWRRAFATGTLHTIKIHLNRFRPTKPLLLWYQAIAAATPKSRVNFLRRSLFLIFLFSLSLNVRQL